MTVPIVVNTEAAAARLSLSPGTLRNMRVDLSGPPHLKIGRRVRYRIADLDAWLAERVVSARATA